MTAVALARLGLSQPEVGVEDRRPAQVALLQQLERRPAARAHVRHLVGQPELLDNFGAALA